MRKIKHILARKEKLAAEYSALISCADKSTLKTWRESIEVMDEVEISQPLNKYEHLQPWHAVVIRRLTAKHRWGHWVDACEREGWTVPELNAGEQS